MSRATVVITLVLALGLAVAAYFLLGQRGGEPDGRTTRTVLGLNPAQTIELSITRPSGRIERIARIDDAGNWVLTIEGPGSGVGRTWPVTAPQVRGMLRILSTLTADQATGEAPGADAVKIGVTQDDGAIRAITLGMKPLSGRVVARVEGPGTTGGTYLVRADLAEAVAEAGILAWRDAALLRGLGPDVSRIELRGAGGSLTLARTQGRWGLLAPVRALAEEEAIGRLVGRLAAAKAVDFLDRGVPDQTGLDAPASVARIETTTRDPSGRAIVRTQELRVGRAADMAGSRVFVAALEMMNDQPRGDPLIAVAGAEPLAAITTDPSAYIARVATPFGPDDVGAVLARPHTGGSRTFTRTLDGWISPAADGATTPLPKPSAGALDALLKLLCATPADSILLAAPEGLPAVSVELRSLGGAALASMELLRPVDSQPPTVTVRADGVWRVYSRPAAAEAVQAFEAALAR
jgi:hypothetical protein